MARLISIALIFGVFLQTFTKLIVIGSYQVNKDYIAQNFCENKDKPRMQCEGKCHLSKQLKEEEQKERAPASPVKEKYEILFFESDLIKLTKPPESTVLCSFYVAQKTISLISDIFHPPRSF